jgi:hypothetical protein
MAWIESHQELGRHPKTVRLAKKLNISIPAAIGHLHLLWWWALDFAPDGNLTNFENYEIAHAIMWENDAELLINALIFSGYLDEIEGENNEIYIHDWHEYCGKLLAKRAEDAKRKKESRSQDKPKRGRPRKLKNTSDGRPTDGAGNSTVTVPNSNSTINKNNTTATAREEIEIESESPPEIVIQKEYAKLHDKFTEHITQKEIMCIHRLLHSSIPSEFIIESMKRIHAQKQAQGETITVFSYYEQPIQRMWREQNAKVGSHRKGNDVDWAAIERSLEELEAQRSVGTA